MQHSPIFIIGLLAFALAACGSPEPKKGDGKDVDRGGINNVVQTGDCEPYRGSYECMRDDGTTITLDVTCDEDGAFQEARSCGLTAAEFGACVDAIDECAPDESTFEEDFAACNAYIECVIGGENTADVGTRTERDPAADAG